MIKMSNVPLVAAMTLMASVSFGRAAFSSAPGELTGAAGAQWNGQGETTMAGGAGQLAARRHSAALAEVSTTEAKQFGEALVAVKQPWTAGLASTPSDKDVNAMVLAARISPVPEVTTMLAGAGAVGLLFLGAGAHAKRNVIRIGK